MEKKKFVQILQSVIYISSDVSSFQLKIGFIITLILKK